MRVSRRCGSAGGTQGQVGKKAKALLQRRSRGWKGGSCPPHLDALQLERLPSHRPLRVAVPAAGAAAAAIRLRVVAAQPRRAVQQLRRGPDVAGTARAAAGGAGAERALGVFQRVGRKGAAPAGRAAAVRAGRALAGYGPRGGLTRQLTGCRGGPGLGGFALSATRHRRPGRIAAEGQRAGRQGADQVGQRAVRPAINGLQAWGGRSGVVQWQRAQISCWQGVA